MSWARALGLALGFAADRVFADPGRGHPVAGFGQAAAELEKHTYADSKAAGLVHETILVGGVFGLSRLLTRFTRKPWLEVALTAGATFVVLGGTTLGREAKAVASRLENQDLPGARTQVGRIVGRHTSELNETEVARAAVETVAENTSDADVAPLVWGALFGVPGLLGYRAINTMDAMVGYKSNRYRNFGWAAAKTDDFANWLPARLSAALVALVRPAKAKEVARIIERDSGSHPSPNAGKVESAFAAALDVQLGGSNSYQDLTEDRGTLGDGHRAGPEDIRNSVQLSKDVSLAALGVAAVVSVIRRRG